MHICLVVASVKSLSLVYSGKISCGRDMLLKKRKKKKRSLQNEIKINVITPAGHFIYLFSFVFLFGELP